MIARLREAQRDPGALRDHGRLPAAARARRRRRPRRRSARGSATGDYELVNDRARRAARARRSAAPLWDAVAVVRRGGGAGRASPRRSASPASPTRTGCAQAFGTVAYGFFPSRAMDAGDRGAADPLGRRARARSTISSSACAGCATRRSPSALSDARAARAGGRVRAARGVRSPSELRAGDVVADVYLGYGLSEPLRRDDRAAAAGAVPAAAARGRDPPERSCATSGTSGVRGRRVGADLGAGRLRGGDRRGARRDRARRRLPGEPRAAPVARRSPATRAALAAALAPLRPLHPRPLVGDGWAIVSASPELFLARRGDRLVDDADQGHAARSARTSTTRRTPPST